MYSSKLKNTSIILTCFFLTIIFLSCSKKNESSPTSNETTPPATSTAETRALLSANTWRLSGIRTGLTPPTFPIDVKNISYLYRFVDSVSEVRYTQIPSTPTLSNYLAARYTIDGNIMVSTNTRSWDANLFFPTGSPLYIFFKDSLMYFNDRSSLDPPENFNYEIANTPLLTFKKQ